MRGIKTIGGWECNDSGWSTPESANRVRQHVAELYSHEDLTDVLRSGDLLPNVNPDDIATWACVKADLAKVLGYELRWPRGLVWLQARPYWRLMSFDRVIESFARLDTDDVATSIVLARIQVRKEKSR